MTTDRTLAVASPSFTLSFIMFFCVCYEEQTVLLIFFVFLKIIGDPY